MKKDVIGDLNKKLIIQLVSFAGISIFWILFNWRFWEKGVYAIGLNFCVYFLLLIFVFVRGLHENKRFSLKDLIWLTPFFLIILSFAYYNNPFLKFISLIVLPIMFALFYNYSFLEKKDEKYWDVNFFHQIIIKIISFISQIGKVSSLYVQMLIPGNKNQKEVISRVIIGVALFLCIAMTVFIPLLSSADSVFADKIHGIYDWIRNIFSLPIIFKIINFIIFTVAVSAMFLTWSRASKLEKEQSNKGEIDPIISGIILSGILILYILFLWIQFGRLWIGELPFDFKETESLVKGGFWQLFILSVINILIYFSTYKKTNNLIQRILGVFTVASLFLLASAGQRMCLYVMYYGFSYEKLFASYTVLYCAILFMWLLSRLFIKKTANIIKFLFLLFIWMYGILTILPVEQIIFRTNLALYKLDGSQIRLFEMTMLSPDVLDLVKESQAQGLLDEEPGYLEREIQSKLSEDKKLFDWDPWINRQTKIVNGKKWYEKNLVDF